MDTFRLGRRPGEWLREPGPEGDVVISTRIRLARNIEGYPFAARLERRKALELTAYLREKVLQCARPRLFRYLNLGKLSSIWRRVLVERHLISREHARKDLANGVIIGAGEISSIMINEEDHLRIQILRSGWRPLDAYELCRQLDRKISRQLPYAYSRHYGYLTSCPTNAGTGLRVSGMVHLPALVLNAEMGQIIDQCEENGLEIRGLYGEGSRAYGDLFQISNRRTLGPAEQEIIDEVGGKIMFLVERERSCRYVLQKQGSPLLESQIQSAVRKCLSSSSVSSSLAMRALSLLRLGIHLGIFSHLPIARINELFLWTQPGHLQQLVGCTMRKVERDSIRSQLVKRWCARHLPQLS